MRNSIRITCASPLRVYPRTRSFGPWEAMGVTFWYSDPWGDEYWADCPVFATASDGSWAACETQPPNDHCLDPTCDPLYPIVGYFVVNVNNVTAPCFNRTGSGVSACSYTFEAAATPVVRGCSVSKVCNRFPASPLQVSSFGISSGVLALNFSNSSRLVASDPVFYVSLGDNACTNLVTTSARSAFCLVNVGKSVAGLPMAVSGYTSSGTINATSAIYTFPLIVSGLSASSGSAAGGTVVLISGSGFSWKNASENFVFIGPSMGGPTVATSAYVLNVSTTLSGATLAVIMPPVPTAFSGSTSAAYDVNVWVQATGASLARATLSAAYTYSTALTPAITSATPLSGPPGTRLTITGTGFASTPGGIAATTVTIGGSACTLVPASCGATTVVCNLVGAPVGSYPILVTVPGAGLARQATSGQSTFTTSFTATSISRSVFGLGGGVSITINGSGFAAGFSSDSATLGTQSVTICNSPCTVTAVTGTSLTCTTGPLTTQAALMSNAWEATTLQPSTGSLTPLLVTAFDGDVGTSASSCTATIDLGPTSLGIVTQVSFFPPFKLPSYLANAVFAGSLDGSTWTTLATASKNPYDGWNTIVILDDSDPGFDFSAAQGYRYLRMTIVSGACTFQEVAWLGYAIAAVPPAGTCPVYVSVTGPSEPRAVLASITPALATSAPSTTTTQLPMTALYSLPSE